MGTNFVISFFNAQCLIISISFLFSFFKYFKENNKRFLIFFVFYNSVAMIVMIPYFLMTNNLMKINYPVVLNNFSLLFGYTSLSYFIIKHIIDFPNRFILYFIGVCNLLFIISCLINERNSNINNYAFAIHHFGLVILCFVYLIKIYRTENSIDVLKISSFWVVSGIFFCSSLSLPAYFFAKTLFEYFETLKLLKYAFLLQSIPSISYIIMHLFFIKAYTCKIYH